MKIKFQRLVSKFEENNLVALLEKQAVKVESSMLIIYAFIQGTDTHFVSTGGW